MGLTDICDNQLSNRLAQIFEKRLQCGFWICELPSRRTLWSDGMFELLDVDRTRFTPELGSINARVHTDDRLSPSELEQVVSTGMTVDREMRILTDRGQLRWVKKHIEFAMDANGDACRMIGILVDITQEVDLRVNLTTQRQRFNKLAEASPLLVWSAGPDGCIDRISGWEKITGLPDQSAEGRNWVSCVHPQDRDNAIDACSAAIESGRAYEHQFRLLTRDGGHLWISARASPLRSANGAILEWIGAATDIHARKQWVMDPTNSIEITGAQLRAARGMLNWSMNRLAEKSGISVSTIRRLEEFDGVTRGEAAARAALKAALNGGGVEFIFPPNGKPGIRPA